MSNLSPGDTIRHAVRIARAHTDLRQELLAELLAEPEAREEALRLLLGQGELHEAFDSLLRARPDALPAAGTRVVCLLRRHDRKQRAVVGGFLPMDDEGQVYFRVEGGDGEGGGRLQILEPHAFGGQVEWQITPA